MGWQLTPYTVPILVAAAISLAVMVPVVRNREQRTALPLIGFLIGTIGWCLTTALQLSETTLAGKLFWARIGFVGTALTTVSFFLLAGVVTDRRQWLTRSRVLGLFVVEAVFSVLAWTDSSHDLFYGQRQLASTGSYVVLESRLQPLVFVSIAFHYLLLAVSGYWLLTEYRQALADENERYQRQLGLMVLALLCPWVVSFLFVTGLVAVNITPIGFAASGLFLAVALVRYRLLELLPIARDTVVESMDNGVFVLDSEGRIADVNARAQEMVRADETDLVGTAFTDCFAETPSITETVADVRETSQQVAVHRDGMECHYDVTVSPITDSLDNDIGRTVVFNDITTQIEREQQLQEREQELDLMRQVFSRVLRHNIRNDLQVVKMHTELLGEDLTGQQRDRIQSAGTMVDDLVSLSDKARRIEHLVEQDQTRQSFDLGQHLQDIVATARTDFPDVEFTVTGPQHCVVETAPAIDLVFENLIENAAEHGSASPRSQAPENAAEHNPAPDPTVEVTLTREADAVQVTISDNGPGIPPHELAVIEEGEETDLEHGSGLGLWVVDWVITNAEADIQFETGPSGTTATVRIPQ